MIEPTVATSPTAVPLSWQRALSLAALTVWLPCLLPVLFGMLWQSGSALSIYAQCLPIIPGGIFAVLLDCRGAWFFVGAAVPTLLLLMAMFFACLRLPARWAHALQGLVIVAVALEAFLFAELALM